MCLFGTDELCAPCVRKQLAETRFRVDKLVADNPPTELWHEMDKLRARVAKLESDLVREKKLNVEIRRRIMAVASRVDDLGEWSESE
jgi:hypothetical protein